ncbi:unnamed protein product, partial [Heterosigma akashiwo]
TAVSTAPQLRRRSQERCASTTRLPDLWAYHSLRSRWRLLADGAARPCAARPCGTSETRLPPVP